MEWSYFGPIVLALILFLLVGTIFEKRIEVAFRQFISNRREHLQQQQQQQQQQPNSEQPAPDSEQATSNATPADSHLQDSKSFTIQILKQADHKGPTLPSFLTRSATPTGATISSQSAPTVLTRSGNVNPSTPSATDPIRPSVSPPTGANHSDPASYTKVDLINRIKTKLATMDPAKARQLGGVFLFNIIKGTTVYSWTMDLNNITLYEGEPEEDPDVTFTLNEHVFKQLVLGKEEAKSIMQAGRCSVTGDIMRAMKLEPYIKLG